MPDQWLRVVPIVCSRNSEWAVIARPERSECLHERMNLEPAVQLRGVAAHAGAGEQSMGCQEFALNVPGRLSIGSMG